MCITRGSLEDHLDKLEEALKRLRDAGLKVNAVQSFFCTHEIEYLGYMLTRGGIKPQIKKIQAILAIKPANNVKELRHFLGMVQYYYDMWVKCSEMQAPLSDLVGECGETKTTRKNKVKKGHRLIYLVFAFFATPGQWQCFIPFQSKGKIQPQNSLF